MSYWLPQKVQLPLTYLEAGWLMSVLQDATETRSTVPDANGNPIPSTIREDLRKRLLESVERAKKQ